MTQKNRANVGEFRNEVSKNMGDYVKIQGRDAVKSIGPYIIELYKNIISENARGSVSISKKEDDEYKILGSNIYDDLSVAKNVYIDLDSKNAVENFVNTELDTIDWKKK